MPERKRVNLTVSPAQKEKWDDAVDDSPEYSSLSDLIRTSVAHELSGESGGDTGEVSPRTTEANTEALDRVTDSLSRMESTLSGLDERLSDVEKAVTSTGRAELKNDIVDQLPEAESDEGLDGETPERIAERIGEDRERVSSILGHMADETNLVTRVGEGENGSAYARTEEF
jgi:Arc/MetJ-type ribon-helix-helix transcriptional regulator